MGALQWAPAAMQVLARLLEDCDDRGVWAPKNLRALPKAVDPITYHYYPLAHDDKTPADRAVDVTFRLAVIATLLGWPVEYL